MLSLQPVYRALNIRPTEAPLVGKLLLLQFMLGIANGIITVSSLGFLLLGKYIDIQQLSWVYITSALLLFPINGLYVRLDLKYDPRQLLGIVIAVALLTIPALAAMWHYVPKNGPWIPIIIASWILMVYLITGYGYWGLAAVFFNVRESRRVFSVIGAGDLPGKMLAYAVIPFFKGKYELELLLLVSLIFFAAAFLINRYWISTATLPAAEHGDHGHDHAQDGGHQTHEHKHTKGRKWWARFFETPLILRIAVFSMVGYGILHLVEFSFFKEIKIKFSKTDDIVQFVSRVLFISSTIALLFKLILSSRIINRLGLARSLVITPILTIIAALSILAINLMQESTSWNLYGLAIIYVFTPILRSVMQEPVFFILFQPLNVHLRLKGHIIAKGYVYPPALMATGLIIYFWLRQSPAANTIAPVLITVILLSIACIFIVGSINKAYVKAVMQSVQKGFFGGLGVFANNDSVTRTLLEKVIFGKEAEKIHAINLLKKSDYEHYEQLISSQLPNASDAFRYYLLKIIKQENYKKVVPLVTQLYQSETIRKTKERLFEVVCELDETFALDKWQQADSHSFKEKKAILRSLLDHNPAGTADILDNLHQSSAAREEDLQLLLSILHKTDDAFQHRVISSVLDTPPQQKETAEALIKALGKCKQTMHANFILHELSENRHRMACKEALQMMGDNIFTQHQNIINALPHRAKKTLLEVASNIKTAPAQQFLIDQLVSSNRLELETIEALYKQGLKVDIAHKNIVTDQFENNLQQAANKLWLITQTKFTAEEHLLERAITNEIDADALSALKLLSLTGDFPYLQRVIELVEKGQKHQMHNAIELLDLTIPKHYFDQLVLLLDFIMNNHKPISTLQSKTTVSAHKNLHDAVMNSPAGFSVWTKSLAWYLAAQKGDKKIVAALKRLPAGVRHPMEEETKQFVLSALSK